MNFIGNQQIEVKLIPDPRYKIEETIGEVDYRNLQTVMESVETIVKQKQDLERTIYISVDEWKENKYNFASQITLEATPGD